MARKSRLKTYMVKYCETVNHFYYKYVDAQNQESAENKADNNTSEWIEDGVGELEERQLVEVYNETDDKMVYEL